MTTNEAETPTPISRLPLAIASGAIGLVLLVTIALIAVRETATFADGTPEAALQRYLVAAFDGDIDGMLEQLTVASRAQCRQEMQHIDRWSDWSGDDLQADLRSLENRGPDNVIATVRFENGSGDDPFGGSWSFEHTFTLQPDGENWFVDHAGWPYQFESCTREWN